MRQRALGLLCLIAVTLLTVADARAERRVALVIGNAHYSYANTLRNPVNDAKDVGALLQKLGFEVILSTDVDQKTFAQKIEQFGRLLQGADVGLFFYAGHGLQVNGKNYLVSTTAKLENEFLIPAETIQLDAIVRLMESRAPVNLVFLDACRNNPLADKLRHDLVAENRAVFLGRGLARVQPSGQNTLIAYSAAPGQEAADGRGRNSPFTSALLKHMPEPGVEVSVMLKEVAAEVRRETRGEQRPQQVSDMSRTFYFVKAEPATAKAAVASAKPVPDKTADAARDQSLEMAYWNSALAVNDCASIRSYLERYPNGIFVDLAKLSERRLCEPSHITVTDAAPAAPRPLARQDVPQQVEQSPPPAPNSVMRESAARVSSTPAAAEVKTALLPPDESVEPTRKDASTGIADQRNLARELQRELDRVGCSTGRPDGIWGSRSRAALRAFSRHAGIRLAADDPTEKALAAVRKRDKRVCPAVAEHPERIRSASDDRKQRPAPSSHTPAYPWCADLGLPGGAVANCGFTTRAQCEATVSGTLGYCYRNPNP